MSRHHTALARGMAVALALGTLLMPAPPLADAGRNASGTSQGPRASHPQAAEDWRREQRRARAEYERELGKLADERARELDAIEDEYARELDQANREYRQELAGGKTPEEAFDKYRRRAHDFDRKYGRKVEKIDGTYYERIWKQRLKLDD